MLKRKTPLKQKTAMKRSSISRKPKSKKEVNPLKKIHSIKKLDEYKDQKALDSCMGEPCYLKVEGVCVSYPNDPTVIAAHSNQSIHGKGRGIKAKDKFTVPACFDCHAWLDQNTTGANREEKFAVFDRALAAWEPFRAAKLKRRLDLECFKFALQLRQAIGDNFSVIEKNVSDMHSQGLFRKHLGFDELTLSLDKENRGVNLDDLGLGDWLDFEKATSAYILAPYSGGRVVDRSCFKGDYSVTFNLSKQPQGFISLSLVSPLYQPIVDLFMGEGEYAKENKNLMPFFGATEGDGFFLCFYLNV